MSASFFRSHCSLLFSAFAVLCWLTTAPVFGLTLEDVRKALASGEKAQALKMLDQMAQAGNADAQKELADLYYDGSGVIQDYNLAAKLYYAAAKQDHAEAQASLGSAFAFGLGVTKDNREAFKWYRKAAEQNHLAATHNVAVAHEKGLGTPQNYGKAINWYRIAASRGFANSLTNLAKMYYEGTGLKKSAEVAYDMFRIAAKDGHSEAQNYLGVLYSRGDGIEQNYDEARRWFMTAAEKQNKQAMNNLGILYDNGFGVPQSDAEAIKWYRKAGNVGKSGKKLSVFSDTEFSKTENLNGVRNGNQPAASKALVFYKSAQELLSGEKKKRNMRKAALAFRQAADLNYSPAQYSLAKLYSDGLGVPQDFVQAHKWYNLAAIGGIAVAKDERDSIEKRMTTNQVNAAQQSARQFLEERN